MITDTIDDIMRKFQHSYVLMDIEGRNYLVELLEWDDDSFICTSPKFGEIRLDEEHVRYNLQIWFPKQGLYNINNVAHVFSRVPERQWKRAPSQNNCAVVPLLSYVNLKDLFSGPGVSVKTLNLIRTSTYPKTVEEALKTMRFSIALSLEFGLTVSPRPSKATHCLWYKGAPIGLVDPSGKKIKIEHKALYQEAVDYFRKREPEWQVTL